MRKKHRVRVARMILVVSLLFLLVAGAGLWLGSSYINRQLLQGNQNMAMDIAQLVKNNFSITDAEVAYMKGLTFNEMEVDPINLRLMNVGNGVQLNTEVINVYLVAPLGAQEIKYETDEHTAAFFGYEKGTKLNGIWLLNGIIDENGHFVATERDDIYRYTRLTAAQEEGMRTQQAFGEFSEDAWGTFITGYAPIFTTEGNFVGLLGIDMDPDKYQTGAESMVLLLTISFAIVSLVTVCLFLFFYFKYIKAKEGKLYFDFYSRMSHDMRTPMNGILGMAALSREENDVDVLHRNFAQVEEAGRYMLGLINDTLDVQKLDAGRLKLDPKLRNCSEIVTSLVDMIRPEAEKKGVRFEVVNEGLVLDCYSYVDELRLQQVFMNLAANAIKFTPKGGTVTFGMKCLGLEGSVNHDLFWIKDTGIGMSKAFIQEHLFHPFEQERNSVTTQYGGSGLGLSIVKNLVELMGGRIEVKSELGQGTTFEVYLDITAVEDETAKTAQQEAETARKDTKSAVLTGRRILLCEDHPLNAEIASRMLAKRGCDVTVAHNGQEGVDDFKASPEGTFDAILMDIRIPVMDGLTAAKTIRALERKDAKTIPMIAMTANTYDEDKKNCLAAGMNAHVAKPVDPQTLFETLEKWL